VVGGDRGYPVAVVPKAAGRHTQPLSAPADAGGAGALPAAPNAFLEALAGGSTALDRSLRPAVFPDFVGQRSVVENLLLAIRATKARGESLDHVLLSGLPGLGKTTLALLIAAELGVGMKETSAPAIQRAADLAGLLTNLEPGEVLFIDEVHRLPAAVEEYLYSAMERFVIDVVIDSGPGARSVRIELPRFTLVGATTREGLLSAPFRSRFGLTERLELYPPEDLAVILHRSAKVLDVTLDADAAPYLAERSRGTPRVANRFLKRVRDLAQLTTSNRITRAVAEDGLRRLGVDERGLLKVDRLLLEALIHADGIPVGLKTLAAAVGEDERTLEDVYEPHLLRNGYLVRSPQGRRATARAYEALGIAVPRGGFAVDSSPQQTLPFS
jgi:holliday junction DNA helicase RuvB